MAKKKFYAVRKGRKTGVFKTWSECQKHIERYSGAEYKSFTNEQDARKYVKSAVKPRKVKRTQNTEKYEMVAYVDGSYEGEIHCASYGVIAFYEGEKKQFLGKEKNKDLLSMRNVAGEIKGAQVAMAYAISKGVKRLYLCYDYEGIEKWATDAWDAKKEGTKAYKKYYDHVKNYIEVIFIKVLAHSGDQYNEEVDQLAKRALYAQDDGEGEELINKVVEKTLPENNLTKEEIKKKELYLSSKITAPIFNILDKDGKCINTQEILKGFKAKWKKRGKNLKDIEDLKIVLDINKMEMIFEIKTHYKNQTIVLPIKSQERKVEKIKNDTTI